MARFSQYRLRQSCISPAEPAVLCVAVAGLSVLGAQARGEMEWGLLIVVWSWGELPMETCTILKRSARFATCECCFVKGNEPASER